MRNVKILVLVVAVSFLAAGCGVVSDRTVNSAAYDAGYWIGSQIRP
ncbi:MAG: hypothetical protein LBJ23_00160 [Tannerella sp.]|jgi:uncharacterized protein YceK|nr:hypothetical protein [Tannerella sp.]